MQQLETTARFHCPKCSQPVTAQVKVTIADKLWEEDISKEEIEVICPCCAANFPACVYNRSSAYEIILEDFPRTRIGLDDLPKIDFDADIAFYSGQNEDEWDDNEPPANPYDFVLASYHESISLLHEHGGDGTSVMNRMVFAQQITALEAYLCDTLINEVNKCKDSMDALFADDKDLTTLKFTLKEIAADPDFVPKSVRKHLRSLLYHKIPKVSTLYKIVFKIDLFTLLGEENSKKMEEAVQYRHDCVHRNGHDTDGNRLDVFTKEYIQEVARIIVDLVDKIETVARS